MFHLSSEWCNDSPMKIALRGHHSVGLCCLPAFTFPLRLSPEALAAASPSISRQMPGSKWGRPRNVLAVAFPHLAGASEPCSPRQERDSMSMVNWPRREVLLIDAQALWVSGDLVFQGWPGSLAGQTQWACCPLRSSSIRAEGRNLIGSRGVSETQMQTTTSYDFITMRMALINKNQQTKQANESRK